MKRKLFIPLLVVLAAAFLWAVGPSVSFSFLLRGPIVLFRELVALVWPTSALDSTVSNASIFTLRRPQLLLESAEISPVATGGTTAAPRATTGRTSVVSAPSVPSAPSVLNPPSPNLLQNISNSVPTNPLTPPIGSTPDILPTITAPSVPSAPSVSVPDIPPVPSVAAPTTPSVPSVSTPSVPSTPTVSVPSTPTPNPPTGGAPSVGGGTPSGGGGPPGVGGGGLKLP